mgnify:CR=1 FL=1
MPRGKSKQSEDPLVLKEMLAWMIDAALEVVQLPHRYHLTELEYGQGLKVGSDLERFSGIAGVLGENLDPVQVPVQVLFKLTDTGRVPRGLRLFFPEGEQWFAFPDGKRCRPFEPGRLKRNQKIAERRPA